ncbi:MAG: hypothetical protein A2Y90_04710 [Chloroflexi bacterium RBG_13_52_12]|nr:MAG: hypothetical protein A2Y90_04710 [Chloroflexi bacterium RBG_13_52_12]
MIEIRYKDNLEASDVAGRTIAEARTLYKTDFNIADKAAAFLNGKKVMPAGEATTILNDKDTLVFKASRGNRAIYMVAALLLAMAITGGIFAYGFNSATATINATIANSDFVIVTANTSSTPSWTSHGLHKSQTGSGTLFDIDTASPGYTGDFSATISLANSGDLSSVYRNLTLSLEVRDSGNNLVDINGDNTADSSDFTLLTLENSTVTVSINQAAPDVYTVILKNGYYICNAGNISWTASSRTPMLYCEVAQK